MNRPQHVPVLLDEVFEYLNVRPGGVVVDATVGLGGHSAEIAKRLGGELMWQKTDQGQWVALIRFERVLNAQAETRKRSQGIF